MGQSYGNHVPLTSRNRRVAEYVAQWSELSFGDVFVDSSESWPAELEREVGLLNLLPNLQGLRVPVQDRPAIRLTGF